MSANSNCYNIQYNLNLSGDLVNVTADDGEELKDRMIGLADNADELFEAVVTVRQAALAKKVFSEGGATTGKPTPTSSNNPDGSKNCSHGKPMKRLDYKKANGEEVHGWYCQEKYTGKGSVCPPIKD